MSAKREFNLMTMLRSSNTECEAEDTLTFSRWELSEDDPDGCDVGLSIDFTIDEKMHNKDEGYYEIYYVPSKNLRERGKKKEKVDKINITYCIDDTCELRDLGKWLIEQANEIDKEKQILEE